MSRESIAAILKACRDRARPLRRDLAPLERREEILEVAVGYYERPGEAEVKTDFGCMELMLRGSKTLRLNEQQSMRVVEAIAEAIAACAEEEL